MIDRTGVRNSFCRENSRHNEQRYVVLCELTSPRTISTVARVQVVRVCVVHMVATISRLAIHVEHALHLPMKKRRAFERRIQKVKAIFGRLQHQVRCRPRVEMFSSKGALTSLSCKLYQDAHSCSGIITLE